MVNDKSITVQYGDTVLFIGKDRKTFLRTIIAGGRLQTHYGIVEFDSLVGEPFGRKLKTHMDNDIWLLMPNVDDIILHLRRETQIIYPKDLGYIMLKMAIKPGIRVIEAGTGSGAMTTVLAMLVGPEGHVYSYDRRAKHQEIAKRNIDRFHLTDRVTFMERDIAEGFDQTEVNALFLDVHNPWEFLPQANQAMTGGGFFGSLIPTMNQVIVLSKALHYRQWFYVQTEEIFLRQYKTSPQRLRPMDQMVGHTGYLTFARKLVLDEDVASVDEIDQTEIMLGEDI